MEWIRDTDPREPLTAIEWPKLQSHPPNPQYMLRKERETVKEVGKEHERVGQRGKSPRVQDPAYLRPSRWKVLAPCRGGMSHRIAALSAFASALIS